MYMSFVIAFPAVWKQRDLPRRVLFGERKG